MKKLIQQHVIYQLNKKELITAVRIMVNNTKVEGKNINGITNDEADVEFLVDMDTGNVRGANIINIYDQED